MENSVNILIEAVISLCLICREFVIAQCAFVSVLIYNPHFAGGDLSDFYITWLGAIDLLSDFAGGGVSRMIYF